MPVIKNKIEGNKVFKSDTELYGMVTGSGKVLSGVELKLFGMVCGDLSLEVNSVVELRGTVAGDVQNKGGKLSVFGVVQGDVITNSGETAIHKKAIVNGQVLNRSSGGR